MRNGFSSFQESVFYLEKLYICHKLGYNILTHSPRGRKGVF